MKSHETQPLIDSQRLREKLSSLEAMQNPHNVIISCYLDTQHGPQACHDFIAHQLEKPRHLAWCGIMGLPDLDLIKQDLESSINQNWHTQAKSLAIFACMGESCTQVEILPLPVSIDNQLSIYSRANILPLLNLLHINENSTLLSFIDGVIQIFDRDLGVSRPIAWAVAPHLSNDRYISDSSGNKGKPQNNLKNVCLSLLKSQKKPLIIAADPVHVDTIKAWLPKKIAWHFKNNIVLPYNLGQSRFIRYVEEQFALQRQIESQNLATRLINSLRFKGPAIAGHVATLDALKFHQVDHLLVSKEYAHSMSRKCIHCGSFNQGSHSDKHCSHCGKNPVIPWNAVIEASWLASKKNIPISVVESDDLHYAGGIGCLLRHNHKAAVHPIQHPSQHRGLDLVA